MSAVRRVKLYEQISERLERRIRDEELAAGEELPSERDLMKEYGVGRPAIREALFDLQRMGLVELRSGARARVATPDPKSVVTSLAGSARYLLSAPDGMRNFQEARTFFETGLVREAARIATPDDIRHLRAALEANRQSIGDVRRFEETDVAFHYAIVVIPRNPIYTALHAAIIEWLVEQRHITLTYPGQNRAGVEAHTAICEAIAAHDPDLAEKRMREHLEQVVKLYWRIPGSGMTARYAITVDFRLKPGALAAFRELIDANARDSCRIEPGCRRFDVLEPKGEADRILLYEIYDDRAAFEAHTRTAHFAQFDKASAPLVAEKRVAEFAVMCEGSGESS